jgi:hypothetical protein
MFLILLRRTTVNNLEQAAPATRLCWRACPLSAGTGRVIVRQLWTAGLPMNDRSDHGDDAADQRRTAALIGLIIILALAIAGVVLVRELRERSRLEDCLMSGRTNCAPIEAPLRR